MEIVKINVPFVAVMLVELLDNFLKSFFWQNPNSVRAFGARGPQHLAAFVQQCCDCRQKVKGEQKGARVQHNGRVLFLVRGEKIAGRLEIMAFWVDGQLEVVIGADRTTWRQELQIRVLDLVVQHL